MTNYIVKKVRMAIDIGLLLSHNYFMFAQNELAHFVRN